MLEYRGFMLDSVRHMQSTQEIKKLIDAIASLGFNKFHWHLTDDQGWRFESEKYPSLNIVSAIRPYSEFGKTYINEPYGRVYTKAEMSDIVSYCDKKGIDVVPEFDIPGHTSAFLASFPMLSCTGSNIEVKTYQGIFKDVLCLAKEETFQTVVSVIDEFLEIFPGEHFHIGGDETPHDRWINCPDCQQYMKVHGIKDYTEYQNCFMNRVIDYLESKNRHCIVWNDAAKGENLDKRAIVQCWKENQKSTVDFINNGGKAILSPFSYCYFDYDYNITPLNRVYSLDINLKGLTKNGRKNIIGIEGTVWTEYIDNDIRLEQLVFPRIIAVSKIAQCKNKIPYNEFEKEVRKIREQMKNISFTDEKNWKKPRLSMISGWLEFVKANYSSKYINKQLFGNLKKEKM